MFWHILKYYFKISLISMLSIVIIIFGLLLYGKISGSYNRSLIPTPLTVAAPVATVLSTRTKDSSIPKKEERTKAPSAMINAPMVKQNPELPSGCELTALTMLFQYYGIKKNKMELLPEMKIDPTPITWSKDGSIAYWGNPNIGYVGDITAKRKAFGIYHTGLFELLQKYIPTGVDLTRKPFADLEHQISQSIPVVVWTTISFTVPADNDWVVWDSPLGPIKTTFLEHSVLLVGYDKSNVYVNDPLSGKKQFKIDKQQFINSWTALGMQALTYNK